VLTTDCSVVNTWSLTSKLLFYVAAGLRLRCFSLRPEYELLHIRHLALWSTYGLLRTLHLVPCVDRGLLRAQHLVLRAGTFWYSLLNLTNEAGRLQRIHPRAYHDCNS
jgi:hypothetical protein